MTIAVYAPVTYAANVGTLVFPIPWPYQSTVHIKAYLDGNLILSNTYVVSAAGASGTMTFTTAPLGTIITLTRELPFDQTVDFVGQGTFVASRHETTYDRLAMQVADLAEKVSRSAKVFYGQTFTNLPRAVNNKLLGWSGETLVNMEPGSVPLAIPADNTVTQAKLAADVFYQVDTITALKALAIRPNSVLVRGYYTIGDGGGGLFRWNSVDGTTDNGGTVIIPNSGGVGRWNRIYDGMLDWKWFGVKGDGTTDDTTTINTGIAAGAILFPAGNFKTNTAIGDVKLVSPGGTFSGTNAIDSPYPAFGAGVFRGIMRGGENCIIGIVHNNKPANTAVFPTGVTGYGRIDNNGNQVFGIFARVDMYCSTGVGTNELNSFNYSTAPSSALPPDRSFGTAQKHPIACTIAAGGTAHSSIGIHICREGEAPRSFLCGLYINYDGVINQGIYVAAHATLGGPTTSAIFENAGSGVNLLLQTKGTATPGNAVLLITDATSVEKLAIKQSGKISYNSTLSQVTRGSAGAATSLPTNPTGYLQIEIAGLTKVIPYYEP